MGEKTDSAPVLEMGSENDKRPKGEISCGPDSDSSKIVGEIREIDRSRPGKTIERRGGRKIRRIRKKIREETNHKLREREKKRERWFGLSVWKEGERRERRKVR